MGIPSESTFCVVEYRVAARGGGGPGELEKGEQEDDFENNMKLVLTLGICNEGNGGGRPFPGSKGAIRCALFVFVHSGT